MKLSRAVGSHRRVCAPVLTKTVIRDTRSTEQQGTTFSTVWRAVGTTGKLAEDRNAFGNVAQVVYRLAKKRADSLVRVGS